MELVAHLADLRLREALNLRPHLVPVGIPDLVSDVRGSAEAVSILLPSRTPARLLAAGTRIAAARRGAALVGYHARPPLESFLSRRQPALQGATSRGCES